MLPQQASKVGGSPREGPARLGPHLRPMIPITGGDFESTM